MGFSLFCNFNFSFSFSSTSFPVADCGEFWRENVFTSALTDPFTSACSASCVSKQGAVAAAVRRPGHHCAVQFVS
jgi:hypothetical protein